MSALTDDLISTVDEILTEFAPTSPTGKFYKRRITRTTSHELIGRDTVVSYSDTLLNPQPANDRIGTFLRLGRIGELNTALLDNKKVVVDDYIFVLSVNAISFDELIDKDVVLIFKDDSGGEETFKMIDYVNPGANAICVVYLAFYRSIHRT